MRERDERGGRERMREGGGRGMREGGGRGVRGGIYKRGGKSDVRTFKVCACNICLVDKCMCMFDMWINTEGLRPITELLVLGGACYSFYPSSFLLPPLLSVLTSRTCTRLSPCRLYTTRVKST